MSVTRPFIFAWLAVTAVAIGLYAYVHEALFAEKYAVAQTQCVLEQSTKGNPNQLLFVSCGGFL